MPPLWLSKALTSFWAYWMAWPGELARALGERERLLRIGDLQLLRLNEGGAGLGQAGARLGADRAAPGDDVVLGGRDLRLRLQHRLAEHLLGALRLGGGIPDALDQRVDLRVRGLEALQRDQRPARGAGQVGPRLLDLLAGRGDDAGEPSVGIRQGGCRRHVLLEFGDERRGPGLAFGEVGAELVDRGLEQPGLSDRLLGGADADGGLAALARADVALRLGQLLVGERRAATRACWGLSATVASASGE